MCLTLPETLISVVGIEKLIPTFRDLEVFLQLLPRSSTGERMNPYNSIWTGVTESDGPQTVHIVLLDNGRTKALADQTGRQALRCIRCAACLNVCPVYERTGGHAYGATYPGPIGAILTPLMVGVEHAPQLPFASSLCGACYEVCPVEIDIPTVLVKLRHDAVKAKPHKAEDATFAAAANAMSGRRRWTAALKLAPLMRLVKHNAPPPLSAWTRTRDLPDPPAESFREWWVKQPMSARDEILGRVRAALGPEPAPATAIPREYRKTTQDGLDSFLERLAHYDARAIPTTEHDLEATVQATLKQRDARDIVAPDGVPDSVADHRKSNKRHTPARSTMPSTGPTGWSRPARWRSRRPGRSCSTAAPAWGGARSRSSPTITCAWSAPNRSCPRFPRPSRSWNPPAR